MDLRFRQRFVSASLVQLWICSGRISFGTNRWVLSIFKEYNVTLWCMYILRKGHHNRSDQRVHIIRFNFNEDSFGGREMCCDWWAPTKLYEPWLQRVPTPVPRATQVLGRAQVASSIIGLLSGGAGGKGYFFKIRF